ncbi:hypothetical protein [Oceanobacillus salinisoli]|uniref:hypothetical protein n=1 Tax=Oceanobacillus salinisoli TaxID=2678611 RepID=UPI0012E2FAA7|nr:hypothetical protein [Oceanobacillus salinisoli]
MKKRLALIIFVILLSGCSETTDQPVIEKAEDTQYMEQTEPVIVEEVIDEEEMNEFIEFQVDEEILRLNLKAVPILNEYLSGVNNLSQAVKQMGIEKLPIEGQEIYLIEFSCTNDLCSYLLINQEKDKQSYLVADLAKFENVFPSPSETNIILQFSRTVSTHFPLVHHIIVVNVESWSTLPLENEMSDTDILHYTWPFQTIEWMDEENISITIPDTVNLNDENTAALDETELNKTTTIKLHVQQNK